MVPVTKLTLDVFCKSLNPKRPTNTAQFEKYLYDSGIGLILLELMKACVTKGIAHFSCSSGVLVGLD